MQLKLFCLSTECFCQSEHDDAWYEYSGNPEIEQLLHSSFLNFHWAEISTLSNQSLKTFFSFPLSFKGLEPTYIICIEGIDIKMLSRNQMQLATIILNEEYQDRSQASA